jgi:hypothetical protein
VTRSAAQRVALLVSGSMLAFALGNAFRAVRDSEWPWLYDALRDAGLAQVILDGRYPADNLLHGETLWFNPMTGFLIACVSWLTGLTPPEASVGFGPIANLFPAVMFGLLAARLCCRWSGVAALAVYLFWNAASPAYAYATYTPWLFASHLALGFFCASLLCHDKASKTGNKGWLLVAGVLHGLTFLTHTAPAVILGCIYVLIAARELFAARDAELGTVTRATLLRLGLLLGTAFLVSLPYTAPILWLYGFEIRNPFPGMNLQSPVLLAELPGRAWDALNLANLFAALGLVRILMAAHGLRTRATVVTWLLVVAAWLALVYAGQLAPGWWPGIVPGHHFHTALTLLRALLCGAGLACAAGWVATRLPGRPASRETIAGSAAALLVLLSALPGYLHWEEFSQSARERSPFGQVFAQQRQLYTWLRENSTPDEVILCDDLSAMVIAAPAARGVVGTMLIFSSPYVDAARRLGDREHLFGMLRAKDAEGFLRLAETYRVRYLLVSGDEARLVRATEAPFIQEAMAAPPWTLYRLQVPAQPENPDQKN